MLQKRSGCPYRSDGCIPHRGRCHVGRTDQWTRCWRSRAACADEGSTEDTQGFRRCTSLAMENFSGHGLFVLYTRNTYIITVPSVFAVSVVLSGPMNKEY